MHSMHTTAPAEATQPDVSPHTARDAAANTASRGVHQNCLSRSPTRTSCLLIEIIWQLPVNSDDCRFDNGDMTRAQSYTTQDSAVPGEKNGGEEPRERSERQLLRRVGWAPEPACARLTDRPLGAAAAACQAADYLDWMT